MHRTLAGGRLEYIDGLRALAALWVLVSHSQDTVFHLVEAEGVAAVLTDWMEYGHLAVVAFIVISGYSLALGVVRNNGWFKNGARPYFRARFRRIVPPYWACVTLSLVLGWFVVNEYTGTKWDESVRASLFDTISHYLLIQDFTSSRAPNYPLWTIAVEWHIYFLFPLLLLLVRRVNLFLSTAAIVVISLAATKAMSTDVVIANSLYLIGSFTLGVAACFLVHAGGVMRIAKYAVRVPWGLVTIVAFVATGAGMLVGLEVSVLNAPMEGAMAALLVTLGLGSAPWLSRLLSWRPLAYVGVFSYSIYLMHAPLVQMVWQFLVDPLDISRDMKALVLMGPGTVLIVAATWVFFYVAERPFLSVKMRAAEQTERRTLLSRDRTAKVTS